MEPVTVSSKGKIYIPKALRERLNLGKGAKLNVHVDGERIILSKPAGWRSLRGIAAGSDLLACHGADKK
jgi:AbrB family looped-hinge helix DNA binding protein